MAGGEGTRLRPMTVSMPKPLLPIVNKPIMEHVLRLLARHGFSDTVVTVQFLASLVRNYFGDGEDLGMSLQYVTEQTPLGTAGSVKNAEALLRDETFLVISGDALTDFDLTDLVKFHHDKGALVTVCLTRVPDPLEFGITIVDDDNRVQRFLDDICEPYIRMFRRVLPSVGPLDLSPIVAIITLVIVQRLLVALIGRLL